MTYEPLHHKYRPQTFAELVGQEAIAATLTNAIRQQKIAPAYLFTGARGTGKTSSARILAKSLNCLNSKVPTEKPCGVCDVCQSIARGIALDVIEIDAASNTGVDNIRELIERAQFAPVQCRYKVYIIDEVHMLSQAAFNALLKTLEEPPNRVVFVLATTDPQRVLPTIISRCQKFDYRRIPLDAMVQHLRHIAEQEQIAIAADSITLVAQLAQGGLRDAESLLDQLSLLPGEIAIEQVWDLVGSVPERDLLELVRAIAQDNPETVIDSNRRLMDRGREPLIVLQNLASFYRDLLIAKTCPDRNDLVALTPPTWQQLCELAKTLDVTAILVGQQHLRSAEVQLKNTTQPRLWLEVTLLGLLPSAIAPIAAPIVAAIPIDRSLSAPIVNSSIAPALPSFPTPAPLPLANPSSAVKNSQSATVQPASIQPTKLLAELIEVAPTQPVASTNNLSQTWQQIVNNLHPLSKALLHDYGRLVAYDGQSVRIGISSEKLLKIAQNQSKNIEKAFLDVFQQTVKISLEVVSPVETVESGGIPAPTDASTNQPSAVALSSSNSSISRPTASSPHSLSQPNFTSPSQQPNDRSSAASGATSDVELAQSIPEAPPSWEVDEGTRAAQQLADFFAGKVVDMNDELAQPSADRIEPGAPEPEPSPVLMPEPWTSTDISVDDDDDDDLPF